MAKLCEILAIEKGVKTQTYEEESRLYKLVQKPDLFNGFTKTYERKAEDGEEFSPENKKVQYTVAGILKALQTNRLDCWQVVARHEWTNCLARADIHCDGVTIADVPVAYLLFLEKQLTDLRSFVDHLPTLDASEVWETDPNSGMFRTAPKKTHRTQKVDKPLVLYPATPEHPAQTQLVKEDVLVGYWNTTNLSGAVPLPEKERLVQRVDRLLRAVKQARERANSMEEVTPPDIAEQLLGYLLGSVI